ncbi:hypothetical protein [uncultured Algibacter sp.]|uniref:hypothetical protein n=1 Tax=uncultured Algibacter sp. TaxID=298659 RepID=UPI003217D6B4
MKNYNLRLTLLILSMVFVFTSCKQDTKKEAIENLEKQTTREVEKGKRPTVNVKEHDKLTSPVLIEVNSQGMWMASEGVLGFVELVDEKGHELARGILTTNENWMTNDPVTFSTELTFNVENNKKGTLIVHKDPGSGDGAETGETLSFKIPVNF